MTNYWPVVPPVRVICPVVSISYRDRLSCASYAQRAVLDVRVLKRSLPAGDTALCRFSRIRACFAHGESLIRVRDVGLSAGPSVD